MSLKLRIYYNAVFGAIGGLLAWYVLGQFGATYSVILRDIVAGAFVGILIGGLMGSIDGVFDRSLYRAGRGAFYGAEYGSIGGIAGLLIGELTLWFMGGGLLGRATGWLCLGLAVGISEGIANKAPRKASYGALGGSLGGFLGGAIFEFLRGSFGSYALSQALGLIILGACIGSLVGFVEEIFRDAWLMVISGKQEGKEFTLAKNVTTIGRDEKCDVALYHDPKIALQHAQIARKGGQFILNSVSGPDRKVSVNGQVVSASATLKNNDRVTVGDTSLLFRWKEKVIGKEISA